MVKAKKQTNHRFWSLLPLGLVALFSIWTIRPLLALGFFPIHDDTQVVRVSQMALALKEGQFPVRWVKDLGYGYGYPIFNFYAPLAYYIGAIFNLIGFGALVATKMMIGLGAVLGGVSMYFLAKEFWGKLGGLMAALFYLYLPYKAVDLYVRGAIAELWALAFLPLVFLGLWLLLKEKKSGIIIGSLGLALVILSHNLTALMLIPFFGLAALATFGFSQKKKLFLAQLSLLVLLGLGLGAFYWLPALGEMNLTQVQAQVGGGADWSDHFVFLDQLWASPWGFAGSASGRLDGMSFMIGKIHLLFAGLVLLVTLLSQRPQKKEKVGAWLAAGLLLLAICLTNQLSAPVWRLVSAMAFIQYPWRFLVLAGFLVSFLAGGIVLYLRRNSPLAYLPAFFIMITLISLNSGYFRPQFLSQTSDQAYLEEFNLKWLTSKISDEYLPKDFPNPQNPGEVAWERLMVLDQTEPVILKDKTNQLVFETQSDQEAVAIINLAYFPSWRFWIDGQETVPQPEEGVIKLTLPSGDHLVEARLTSTLIQKTANFISLFSLGGLFFLLKRGGDQSGHPKN